MYVGSARGGDLLEPKVSFSRAAASMLRQAHLHGTMNYCQLTSAKIMHGKENE